MAKLNLSPQAREDLAEYSSYIALDNPSAATNWLAGINEKLLKVADFPGIGRPRPELGSKVRSIVQGSHIIFYRVLESNVIHVVRILHGARRVAPPDLGESA